LDRHRDKERAMTSKLRSGGSLRLQVRHDEIRHHLPHVFDQQRVGDAVP